MTKPTHEEVDAVADRLSWHDDDVVAQGVTRRGETRNWTRSEVAGHSAALFLGDCRMMRSHGVVITCLRAFETADKVLVTPANFDQLSR